MNPHLPIALAVTFLLVIVSTTACTEDAGSLAPDNVAEAYCETTIACFDDIEDDELDDCIDEMTEDYTFHENEFGDDCRDALLETDHCLSRQSCEDIRNGAACRAEFDREDQICTHGNND